MRLKDYMQDGAGYQARAILAHLQSSLEDYSIEEVKVGRWENCREQGYITSLVNDSNKQLNIVFYEYRDSDGIGVIVWGQNSLNSLTIDTIKKGVFTHKTDTTIDFNYGEYKEAGDYIAEEFRNHIQYINYDKYVEDNKGFDDIMGFDQWFEEEF